MKIDHYSFGKITINGTTYSSDVIIFPDRVNSSWWRLEGHLLQIPDLKEVMNENLSMIIIGTGYYSAMKVPEETLEHLKSNNIKTYIEDTQKAVKRYNEIAPQMKCAAALHLTC